MGTVYFRKVSADDHKTLRSVCHNYPAYSYDKWLQFQAKEIAEWSASGDTVIEIDLSADDFARYCRDTGARPDLNTFRGIAAAKSTGKFK